MDEVEAHWRWPDEMSDEDVAELESEFAGAFGADVAGPFLDSLQVPIPPDVVDGFRRFVEAHRAIDPDVGMPSVDEVIDAHEHVRRIMGRDTER